VGTVFKYFQTSSWSKISRYARPLFVIFSPPSFTKNRGKKHAYGIAMLCLFSHLNFGISSTTFINFGTEDVQAEGNQSTYIFNLPTKKYQIGRKEKA